MFTFYVICIYFRNILGLRDYLLQNLRRISDDNEKALNLSFWMQEKMHNI